MNELDLNLIKFDWSQEQLLNFLRNLESQQNTLNRVSAKLQRT